MRHGMLAALMLGLASLGCMGSSQKLPDAFRADFLNTAVPAAPAPVHAERISDANAHEQAEALLRELEGAANSVHAR